MLLTKLHRPSISPNYLFREGLIQKLEENLYKPLTLVAASAGYGKSTLVSSWIESKGHKAAWISLSKDENDFLIFLEYLAHSIDLLFPNSLRGTKDLIEASKICTAKEISHSFVNEIDVIEDEFILVLDDYHGIVNKEIHNFINEVIKYPPEGFHFVIITRIDPPLNLNVLRAYNRMSEIRMNDLSFDKDLIVVLFEKLHGLELPDKVAEQLQNNTEGWITALILYSIASDMSSDSSEFLLNVPEQSVLTNNFLFEEVFKKQENRIQKLLMISSLFDQFSSELIEELVPVLDSDDELFEQNNDFVSWLKNANFFIVQLDNDFKWYRYHHLLQDLLRAEAKKNFSHDEIIEFHGKAASWYNTNQIADMAVKNFISGENYKKAIEIILLKSRRFNKNEGWNQIKAMADKLPRKVVNSNPALLMIDAWYAYSHFNLEAIPLVLEKVEPLLKKESDHNLIAEFNFMKGNILYWMGDIDNSLALLGEAIDLIDDDQIFVKSEAILIWAFAKQMAKDEVTAINYLQDLLKEEGLDNKLRGYAYGGLTFIALLSGKINDSIALSLKMIKVVSDSISYNLLAWGDFLLASSSFQNFDLKNAINHFKINLKYHYSFDTRGVIDAYVGMILAYQINNQSEEADKSMQLLEEYVKTKNDPYFTLVASSCKARLHLLQKKELKNLNWLMNVGDEIFNGALFIWLEVSEITKLRVLLSQNDSKSLHEASELIEKLEACVENANFIFQEMDIQTLKALLHFKKGEIEIAVSILKECIDFAQSNGWIRPFVETFIHDPEFLLALKDDAKYKVFIQEIHSIILNYNSRIDKHDLLEGSNNVSSIDHEIEKLTKRESETLVFLSKGLRNKEIADLMFVSTDAVKKNFYRIFQKLNVKNRIELLNKAKDIGLLEVV